MPVTLQFTADVLEPDLYNDVQGLPDPFGMAVMIGISNTYSAGLYFRVRLVSPPAAWLAYQVNLGLLNAGASSIYSPTFARNIPTLTVGEYDETVTMRLEAFSDAGYSVPYGSKDLSVAIHHFDHLDPAWTVIDHSDFNVDACGWTGWSSTWGGIRTDQFYSSPSSMRVSFVGSYSTGHCQKTLNTGVKAKARFVCHWRAVSAYEPTNDRAELRFGAVVKKSRMLLTPNDQWVRLCYDFPVNQNILVDFICYYLNQYDYHSFYIDEIWVIAKS